MSGARTFNGEAIRQRRLELDLTHADVYRAIHIPEECLDALETGNFCKMPGTTYTLGFLKTYCKFLGIEEAPYLQAYQAYQASTRPTPGFLGMTTPSAPEKRLLLNDILTWVTACAIVALAWAAYVVVVQPDAENADTRVQAETIEMVIPPTTTN